MSCIAPDSELPDIYVFTDWGDILDGNVQTYPLGPSKSINYGTSIFVSRKLERKQLCGMVDDMLRVGC